MSRSVLVPIFLALLVAGVSAAEEEPVPSVTEAVANTGEPPEGGGTLETSPEPDIPSGDPPPPPPPSPIPVEVPPFVPDSDPVRSSSEQGQTSLTESFEPGRTPLAPPPEDETHFRFQFRTMSLDRRRFNGSTSKAVATGGWIGARTPYLGERVSFGVTGYTSQRISGDPGEGGTGLLEPEQAGFSVLGEVYTDVDLGGGLHFYAGRMEFDTPFINRNDSRMVPNTFEMIALQGLGEVGDEGATLKYGVGWFDKIKGVDSEEFVPMSVDAGAPVDRGVLAAGALYQRAPFSIGAIDYHCADVLNILYGETKLELPVHFPVADNAIPVLAAQFVDQRSVGEERLPGRGFSSQQVGFKCELPVGPALFTTAYTVAGGDPGLTSPWSGYPGYTSVQIEDFNRAGEGALIFRAACDFPCIEGLSAYTLYVNGSDPDHPAQFRRDELDLNLQWAPVEDCLKGFSLRLRYALVEDHGPVTRDLTDFRVICNYQLQF